jgi:hypothetical protein
MPAIEIRSSVAHNAPIYLRDVATVKDSVRGRTRQCVFWYAVVRSAATGSLRKYVARGAKHVEVSKSIYEVPARELGRICLGIDQNSCRL